MSCRSVLPILFISALLSPVTPGTRKSQPVSTVDKLAPQALTFEENRGQTDAEVHFLARTSGYTLFLTRDGAVMSLAQHAPGSAATRAAVNLRLIGADPKMRPTGVQETAGRSNYFVDDDRRNWRTGARHYRQVRYAGVYPGMDLVFYGTDRQVEYDFVVHAGADPAQIRLDVRSGDGSPAPLRVAEDGDVIIATDAGDVRLHKPVAYQAKSPRPGDRRTGKENPVACRYVLNAQGHIAFETAQYDRTKPLLIDPVLSDSTYLGGTGSEQGPFGGPRIATDSAGNAYITGITESPDFPRVNALPFAFSGSPIVFVTKLNAAGSMVYSTYLGAASTAVIAADSSGNAYVTGTTTSPDFPKVNALRSTLAGGSDVFVAKLNATGAALIYSTLIGGAGDDTGNGVAVDSGGNAYITGGTTSINFPVVNALQPSPAGNGDAFVLKLNASGSALLFSTFLGGTGSDSANGIALDSANNAYVTGATLSPDFPVVNAFQPSLKTTTAGDGFVARLNAAGSALVFSTYLGGRRNDYGTRIAVDAGGNAWVLGRSASADFPTMMPLATCGAFVDDGFNGFLARLSASGSALLFSTSMCGLDTYGEGDLGLDSAGNVYVARWGWLFYDLSTDS